MTNRHRLSTAFHRYRFKFNRLVMHMQPVTRRIMTGLNVVSFLAALASVVGLILFVGFDHTAADVKLLARLIKGARIVFIVAILFGLIFDWAHVKRYTRLMKWVLNIAMLLTLLPLIYPQPVHPWIPWLSTFLYSKAVIFSITGIYAVWEISFSVTNLFGHKINPSLLLACSFLFFIIIGSFVLKMPRCTHEGITYIDSLFVSTSAVCITGLSTVDVSSTFTPFGVLVLSILIQIGGLGVMTFTSFFALFFTGNNSIYSQMVVKDMVNSKSINSLLPTLLYIMMFTLVIEAVGAVLVWFSIHGTMGMTLEEELIFSGFHSLSAFCNAGFSNIAGGLSSPQLLLQNQSIYLILSALIFLGGIGFPLLVNFKSAFAEHFRRLLDWMRRRRHIRKVRIYDMNTRIVLSFTIALYILSAAIFFIVERNNTLAGMPLSDQIVQSIFNAFSPRSSGFISVNPARFMPVTIIVVMIMMWIGGASQSTAGGIKVNTFAVILLELKAVITGNSRVVVYNRTLAHDSIRRAFAVVTISILSYAVVSLLLIAFEPALSIRSLLFEAASALFTVGSSLGITDRLGLDAKLLLCIAMFVGRVGLLSLLTGMVRHSKKAPLRCPEDNVIIN